MNFWHTQQLALWDVTGEPKRLLYCGLEDVDLWKKLDDGWYGGSIVMTSPMPTEVDEIGTDLAVSLRSENPHILGEVVMRFRNCRRGHWQIDKVVTGVLDECKRLTLRRGFLCDIWIKE